MKTILFTLFLITFTGAIAQRNEQTEQRKAPEDSISNVVDVRASYIGGYSKLKEFVSQNMQYPSNAPDGTVYVELLINADGSIGKTRIQREIDNCEACNAEALRVVSSMPKWKPAILAGKNVASYYYLPIRFESK